MAWIKSDETLSQHPKVDLLADLLQITPVQVVGHLHYLWWWCLSYADNGDLTRYRKMIAKASRFDESKNDTFIDALVETGWLDQKNDKLWVHDWEDYHGALMETRENNKIRQQRHRAKKNEIELVESNNEITDQDIVRSKPNKSEMFKAMVEVVLGKSYEQVASDITKDERGRINTAVKQLAEIGATPEDIHARGLNYMIKYGERPTPQALTGGWNRYEKITTEQQRKKNVKKVNSYKASSDLMEWAKEVDNA